MRNGNPFSERERAERLDALRGLTRVWPPGVGGPCDTTPGLIHLASDWVKSNSLVCEVGSFRGVSTRVFACFAWHVFAVDPWGKAGGYDAIPPEQLQQAELAFVLTCRDWPNIIRADITSLEAARLWPGSSLDLVYLDGDHRPEAFIADVRAWLPRLRPEGILSGHDFALVGPHFSAAGLPPPLITYADDSWALRACDVPQLGRGSAPPLAEASHAP